MSIRRQVRQPVEQTEEQQKLLNDCPFVAVPEAFESVEDCRTAITTMHNPQLFKYVLKAYSSGKNPDWPTDQTAAINQWWDKLDKIAAANADYVKLYRESHGFETEEGWLQRERQDSIDHLINGLTETEYSNTDHLTPVEAK